MTEVKFINLKHCQIFLNQQKIFENISLFLVMTHSWLTMTKKCIFILINHPTRTQSLKHISLVK